MSDETGSSGFSGGKDRTVLLLRWVLIVATSYLLLFHRPFTETPPLVGLFVAVYLASNFLVGYILPRARSPRVFHAAVVLLDTGAVSLALLLTQDASTDFFLLYFVVMLVGAFAGSTAAVAGAAILIGLVHFFTIARFMPFEQVMSEGQLLRIPFLFVVGLFFGHLVQRARDAEKEAEDARRAESRQKAFVAEVTHDLKNPLGIIRGMAEMLLTPEAGSLTPQQSDLVRRIHNGAQQVITLALNVLDANRIETGRLQIRPETVPLHELVEDGFQLGRTAGELRDVSLEFVVRDLEVPPVQVDPVHMGRVVWNLIDNAIKYSPKGGSVLVSVGVEKDSPYVSVSDTGAGIPPDRLARIFERYHETSGGEGSGLGLFIVKAVTEAHGGTLEVESEPGRGTRFTVRLPAAARRAKRGEVIEATA